MSKHIPAGIFLVLLTPFAALAAPGDAMSDSDLLVRIGAPVDVKQGETVGTLFALGGDVAVDGVVRESLIAVGGDVAVRGTVEGQLDVVGGTLRLLPGATVGNVVLTGGHIERAPDATVRGVITDQQPAGAVTRRSTPGVFWLGWTLFLMLIGWAAAAMFPRALRNASTEIRARALRDTAIGFGLWLCVPVLTAVFMLSIVGIPIAIALLTIAAPLLWLGSTMAGAYALGTAMTFPRGADGDVVRVLRGIAILRIASLVPVLGSLLSTLVMLAGTGAIGVAAALAWRRRRSAERGPVQMGMPGLA